MKTQVLKSLNGNFVAMINGIETFISADGLKFNPVEKPCFDHLVKYHNQRIFEVESEIPSEIASFVTSILQNEVNEISKVTALFDEHWNSTQEVKRIDVDNHKLMLRSDNQIYLYQNGWVRRPLNEWASLAVQARIIYNIPLDKSNLLDEILVKIQETEQAVRERLDSAKKREQKIIDDYNNLIKHQPIEATVDNISIILNFLNTQNWGSWNLPKLTIGYSAHQYDCDGKTASTITLNKPISDPNKDIQRETKFEVGAPHGHLTKYRSL